MGVHKLTAGDGYAYLTRQVAVHDATDRGYRGLADYYAEKGESAGRWFGAGLDGLGLAVASEVTETQMRNLFGEGRHPNAERLEDAALDAGHGVTASKKASQLGRVFAIYRGNQPEFIQETARRYTAHNLAHGKHWKTPVPSHVRARIRTELGNELFNREHGRAPLDDRELAGFMAKATRQQTTAVAGYDLTFTPVKSVSALWALAGRDVASQVEAAHHAAVEATLEWLEREVLFTRRGRGGIQQVKARGLVAGMFTHRDSRSSDPHLHTHVAVSNKVQDLDGNWLAVDGRVLYKANVTCSETYNTLLEAELIARLRVRFESRSRRSNGLDASWHRGAEKRPVREIVGIDQRLAAAWSKRDTAIEARRRDLATAFQAEHGRPPTEGEAVTLKEQAWEQTRRAKHEPRSEADQRAAWYAEATAILGDEQAVRDMVVTCLGHTPTIQDVTDEWSTETARRVVERVAEDRATWQVWHLRAEAQRQARAGGIRLSDLDAAVDRVVDAAIAEHSIAFNDPDPLTRAITAAALDLKIPAPLQRTEHDPGRGPGRVEVVSAYSLGGGRQYTSLAVIDAEQRIIDAARRVGGRTISEVRVGIAVAEAAANSDTTGIGTGLQLTAAQQSLVREMATSGRAVQLALAPAGTGKTTAMQVLTRAWQDSGGTVIGLAPSAVAAQELGAAIDPVSGDPGAGEQGERRLLGSWRAGHQQVHTDTVAKLVWHAHRDHSHGEVPSWMEQIDGKTLVLIDEAGMAATTDLAAAIDYITARGGQVRLIGDDRQLGCVGAGGVLRDIAHQVGAVTLTEVHRFRTPDGSPNHAEAAATLALRAGDPSAIAFYADRGRIHVGDLGICADQAYAAWTADRAAGTDSLLLAPIRDLVAELNTRARCDRITGLSEKEIGRVLTLTDGTNVSTGDRIITRENNRLLPITKTDWVKNGDRWTVRDVNADGSLSVVHDQLGKQVNLPAGYVCESVQLGYATTVHGAQGLTAGTCHVVLTGEEDRNLLYVALSRGRYANHLYLNTTSDGDPHSLIRPEALVPPTALERVADMLCRDGSAVSATTTMREQTNPHRLLRDLAARYHDALTAGAVHLIGVTGMGKIDTHAEALSAGWEQSLTDAPAWPTLRSHLALLALDDYNPLRLLDAALAVGSLADARDPAAVLDARVDDLTSNPTSDSVTAGNPALPNDTESSFPGRPRAAGSSGPLPWLPGIPARLADNLDWGPFLATYHQLAREQVAAVRETARGWTGATAPAWAQPFLADPNPNPDVNRDISTDTPTGSNLHPEVLADLRADLAVWRAVTNTPETDLRPTGSRVIGAPGTYQTMLNRAVRTARPSYPFAQRAWYQALPETVRHDPWITPLCRRLARLERAGLPVADYINRALTTNPADLTSAPDTVNRAGTSGRPLPEEQQAAALWWRLVQHLGPAALDADQHSANLLQPQWRTTLIELVGAARADCLQTAPAWPALVAAVDEACQHHGWTPRDILTSTFAGLPQDGSLTGVGVADALVLRIATLTDQPPVAAPDRAAPLQDDQPPEPVPPDPELLPLDEADSERSQVDWAPLVDDPYLPPLPRRPQQQEEDATSSEHAFPGPNEVPAERILELNRQAMAYYESCYPRSWAPAYLRERLGTDLADHPTFAVGYAPPGPRSLLNHLTSRGASLEELDQAGLIRTRAHRAHRAHRTGRAGPADVEYVDAFRDRLIMPIRDPHDHANRRGQGQDVRRQAIIGFLGRRNPTKGEDDYAGPKYLNTRTTPVFTKGQALFGYGETRDLLAAGALPVLVEGPIDAYAITLGSNGTAIGLGPMGTALTVDQVKLLRAHLDLVNGRDRVAVATDADPAGWRSAQVAFWHLTAAGLDPTLVELPDRLDPAALLQAQGADAIATAIENRAPVGDAMIDHLLRTAGHWSEPVVRQQIITQAARIIGSRGSETWRPTFERLNNRLHLSPGILEHRTLTESIDRDRNTPAYTQARIAELHDQTPLRRARPAPMSRQRLVDRWINAARATLPPELTVSPPVSDPHAPTP